jgi:hypothetical protein
MADTLIRRGSRGGNAAPGRLKNILLGSRLHWIPKLRSFRKWKKFRDAFEENRFVLGPFSWRTECASGPE